MKTYRFVSSTHQDVTAETLEEAIDSFNKMRREGVCTQSDTVVRIEVEDENGEYISVDHPLRAGYVDTSMEGHMHLSS